MHVELISWTRIYMHSELKCMPYICVHVELKFRPHCLVLHLGGVRVTSSLNPCGRDFIDIQVCMLECEVM